MPSWVTKLYRLSVYTRISTSQPCMQLCRPNSALSMLPSLLLSLTTCVYVPMSSCSNKRDIVIQVFMSAGEWDKVDYSRVPSVCMKRNKKHFQHRDKERFTEFLGAVKWVLHHRATAPCLKPLMSDITRACGQWRQCTKVFLLKDGSPGMFCCLSRYTSLCIMPCRSLYIDIDTTASSCVTFVQDVCACCCVTYSAPARLAASGMTR